MNRNTGITLGLGAVTIGTVIYLATRKKAAVNTKATIYFTSSPSGASVSINDVDSGPTPFSINLDPGIYTIITSLNGYTPQTQTVTLVAGQKLDVNTTLILIPVERSYNFSVSTVGLETLGATCWECCFQDTATGEYYPPTNAPAAGGYLFAPGESIEITAPVRDGLISLVASGTPSGNLTLPLIAAALPEVTLQNGANYVFDWSNNNLI